MSLNWNVEKVKNYKEITAEGEWAVTDILIWATMFVGFTSITEANYKEFYKRLHFVEKLKGTFLNRNGKPYFITEDEVKRRIGLSTNAGSFSRTEFIRRQTKSYFAE